MMTKKSLIEQIESENNYRSVRVSRLGAVTGIVEDEPARYDRDLNRGGRRLIGIDTELVAALVDAGRLAAETAETYAY